MENFRWENLYKWRSFQHAMFDDTGYLLRTRFSRCNPKTVCRPTSATKPQQTQDLSLVRCILLVVLNQDAEVSGYPGYPTIPLEGDKRSHFTTLQTWRAGKSTMVFPLLPCVSVYTAFSSTPPLIARGHPDFTILLMRHPFAS